MITLHFRTDKTNKSNYNTFVCLKENGAVLIGESCQESDKKKRKEWKEKLLKDWKELQQAEPIFLKSNSFDDKY